MGHTHKKRRAAFSAARPFYLLADIDLNIAGGGRDLAGTAGGGAGYVYITGVSIDDENLLANCTDYMDEMTLYVIETNKILKKSSSTRARLEHPPLWKPKKKKAPGFLNQLNGGN